MTQQSWKNTFNRTWAIGRFPPPNLSCPCLIYEIATMNVERKGGREARRGLGKEIEREEKRETGKEEGKLEGKPERKLEGSRHGRGKIYPSLPATFATYPPTSFPFYFPLFIFPFQLHSLLIPFPTFSLLPSLPSTPPASLPTFLPFSLLHFT